MAKDEFRIGFCINLFKVILKRQWTDVGACSRITGTVGRSASAAGRPAKVNAEHSDRTITEKCIILITESVNLSRLIWYQLMIQFHEASQVLA